MEIHGLQKLTLLDYPGKTACTVFLGGCNFRCPFCHNRDLVLCPEQADRISADDLFSFLKKRRGLLEGVCVTGGEPLLYPELESLLSAVRSMGFSVKLDTNGSRPTRLKRLVEQGLVDYVAMDIKNAKEQYKKTVGCPSMDLSSVGESVRYLLSGAVDYEFRTTMVREFHTEEDFSSIGRWIRGAKRYFLQSFVDSGHLVGSAAPALARFHGFDKEEAQRIQSRMIPFVPAVQLRGYDP